MLTLLALTVGAILVAIYFPIWRSRHRTEYERAAFTAMKILSSAEADYRFNDRDGNKINDFWTADVAGLYKLGLIPRELAEADIAPLVPLVPQPVPYKGHYFRALIADHSETPPVVYRQETDKTSGKVHHLYRFGFLAYPAEPGVSGNYMYMINENNSVFRAVDSLPHPDSWPSLEELQSHWSMPQ
jgi:hypothetical protein